MNKQLTPREEMVLRLRKERKTLEAIGRHFGVTRERIRQIEKKVLKKIGGKYGKMEM